MSMMPDHAIREMVIPTNGASPGVFVPETRSLQFGQIEDWQIQPASLDVRLGPVFLRHPSGERVRVAAGQAYSLAAGECVLASLVERINLNCDNVAARIEGKSSWARKFLTVHSAGFIDPGFQGDVTLELKNDGHARIELPVGAAIAQISFHFLAAPAERLYGQRELQSHYQHQKGPTPSWILS